MRRSILILVVLLVGAIASVRFAMATRRTGAHDRRARFTQAEVALHRDVLPVLNRYCWDCHGDGMSKGDVILDAFTNVTAIVSNRVLWERVLQNVRSGDMPPKKKPQPSAVQRDQLVAWIDGTLYPIDPEHPDPGRVTLRRLNRTEYNNTIRDLVGVDFRPADDFPQDDVGYGFDNIGDVLSLPPVLWERYLRAAELILDEAIVTGPRPPKTQRFGPGDLKGHQGNGALATLASNGEMTLGLPVRFAGEYIVRINAYGDQAGPPGATKEEKAPKMALRIEGRDKEVFNVTRSKGDPKKYERRIPLDIGNHRLGIAFLNDYYREWTEDVKNKKGETEKKKHTDDRNLHVLGVELVGPFSDQIPPLSESHQRIFFRKPDGKNDTAVARAVIDRFASRAFRRPATRDELDRLCGLYERGRTAGDSFEMGVREALTAVLVSPHFLFRGELQTEPDNPRSVHPVDEYALASRLSYFLWSTLPDEELLTLAAKGKLRKQLPAQVARMVRDPKSRALTDNFAAQWLQLRTLGILTPDVKKFPEFDETLRTAMRRETESLFDYIVRENRPVTEFLTADYTFVNERLAKHYGIAGVKGEDWVKVSVQGSGRSGVLTHASVLTLTSNPTRTSPVKRGKWVLENILGTPPPPPPPGVPPLDAKELKGTLRQRMEQHRENAACASCHARMDAIGFAFEHFDAIGRFRNDDGGFPVETQGVLPSGEKFQDQVELTQLFAGTRSDDFTRCLSEKLLTYALGRGLEYYDRPTVALIQKRLAASGFRFTALVEAVVESVPFQMRRGEGDPLLAGRD